MNFVFHDNFDLGQGTVVEPAVTVDLHAMGKYGIKIGGGVD